MGFPSQKQSSIVAANQLALHLKKHLGMEVEGLHLRNYILAHWNVVSSLAHDIHGTPQETDNA